MKLLPQLDFINQQWDKSSPKKHFDFWESNSVILSQNVLKCPEIFYFTVYLTSFLGYQKIDEKVIYGKADKALIENAKKKIIKLHTQNLGDDYDSVYEMARAQAFYQWFTHYDLSSIYSKLEVLIVAMREEIDALEKDITSIEANKEALSAQYDKANKLYDYKLTKLNKEKKDDPEYKKKKQTAGPTTFVKKFLHVVLDYVTPEESELLLQMNTLRGQIDEYEAKLQEKKKALVSLKEKYNDLQEISVSLKRAILAAWDARATNENVLILQQVDSQPAVQPAVKAEVLYIKAILTGKTTDGPAITSVDELMKTLKKQFPERSFDFINNLYNLDNETFSQFMRNQKFKRTVARCHKFFNPDDPEIVDLYKKIWEESLKNDITYLKFLYNWYSSEARGIVGFFNQFMLSYSNDVVIPFYLGLFDSSLGDQYPANIECISAFFNQYLMGLEQRTKDYSNELAKRNAFELVGGTVYKSLGSLEDSVITARQQESVPPRALGPIMDAVVQLRNDLSDIGITPVVKTKVWRKQEVQIFSDEWIPVSGQEIHPNDEVVLQTMGVCIGNKTIAEPICRKIPRKENNE